MGKNWAEILNNYSSGEDSDAHDDLNVMSVQKNAHRVAELLHGLVPGLDRAQSGTLPMGMNTSHFMRQDLERAASGATPRSSGCRSSEPSAAARAPAGEPPARTGAATPRAEAAAAATAAPTAAESVGDEGEARENGVLV